MIPLHKACFQRDLDFEQTALHSALEYVQINDDYVFASNGALAIRHHTGDLFEKDFVKQLKGQSIYIHRSDWGLFLREQEYDTEMLKTSLKVDYYLNGITTIEIPYLSKLPDEITYPDVRSLFMNLPAVRKLDSIFFDAEYLKIAQECFHSNGLYTEFTNEDSAMILRPHGGCFSNSMGILMPMQPI